jgi:rare lipoprotein A
MGGCCRPSDVVALRCAMRAQSIETRPRARQLTPQAPGRTEGGTTLLRSHRASCIAPRHAAIGAFALGSTLSATALAFAEAPPVSPATAAVVAQAPIVEDARLRLGQRTEVRGRLGAAAAGRRIALQHHPRGQRWRVVATGVAASGGRYAFQVRLRRSGALRVVTLPDVPGAVSEGAATSAGGAVAAEAPLASRARRVAVAGRLVVGHGGHDVRAGEAVRIRGTLLPRVGGRRVVVEMGARGRWQAVARARTRPNGHFDTRVVARALGTQRLRVRFAGDRRNAGTRAGAGTLQAYRPSLASWYALYGNRTACGQTLGYGTLGVAHKTLPCGTRVTLRYGGREVTVPVIDRGPFAHGREWDLTGATARALGFSGVGIVWTTV